MENFNNIVKKEQLMQNAKARSLQRAFRGKLTKFYSFVSSLLGAKLK